MGRRREGEGRGTAPNQLHTNGSFGVFPYEPETLAERGELVPRSMVVGRELGEPLPDLSELFSLEHPSTISRFGNKPMQG